MYHLVRKGDVVTRHSIANGHWIKPKTFDRFKCAKAEIEVRCLATLAYE